MRERNPVTYRHAPPAIEPVAAEVFRSVEIPSSEYIEEEGAFRQSTDYDGTDVESADASTGWRVESEGDAEFNNVRVRGEVVATEFHGAPTTSVIPNGNFEVDTSGWAAYSGGLLDRVTSPVYSGSGALRVSATALPDFAGAQVTISASPGDVIHVQAQALLEALHATASYNWVSVYVFGYAGGVLQRSEFLGTVELSAGSFWTLINKYWVVPSDTTSDIDQVVVAFAKQIETGYRFYLDEVVIGFAPNLVVPMMITHDDDTRDRTAVLPGGVHLYGNSTYAYGLKTLEAPDYAELLVEGPWDGVPQSPRIRLIQNWTLGSRIANTEADYVHLGNTNNRVYPGTVMRARRSAADQALITATTTVITYDQSEEDSEGGLNLGTGIYTVTREGTYLIAGTIRYQSNATGVRQCAIRINGNTMVVNQSPSWGGAGQTVMSAFWVDRLASGDRVWMTGYQTSGGNLNAEASSSAGTNFRVVRVGP